MIFIIYVIYCWDMKIFYYTSCSRIRQIFLWIFQLISFVLIFIRSRSFKFYLRCAIIWRHFLIISFRFDFILRIIIFITWSTMKRHLRFYVCALWNLFWLYSWWLYIMWFVGSYTFKFNSWTIILPSWWFIVISKYILILWILNSRSNTIRFILFFISALPNKRYLI